MLPAVESGFARVLQLLCEQRGRVKNQQILGENTKTASPPGRGATTAEAAPRRIEGVGVGEHDEKVAGRVEHLIALPRENGSEVRKNS